MSTPRSLFFMAAALAALLVLLPAPSSRAQTQFTHDTAGNRSAQQAGAVTTSPTITLAPSNQIGRLGGTAQFSVMASGPGPFTYEWFKDGVSIPGATSDTLTLTGLVSGDFTPTANSVPKYYVRVTNASGSDISTAAELYKDTQGAGLPDWWRQQHFGSLDPVNPYADADADGVTNGQEYEDGTQPANAASRRARITLVGPQSLMSKSPSRETYASGSSAAAYGYSSGELQFGGFTGSQRTQSGGLGFTIRGSGGITGDVVLKGLFGSMPVQKTAAATPSFTYASGSGASVTGFATTPHGPWLGYGFFNRVNGQTFVGVARFAADGTLDTSFNPSPNSVINGAAILPDGKVILAGFFSELGGQQRSGVARLLPNGTVDPAFTLEAGGENLVIAMEVQRDGKILLGGSLWDGTNVRPLLRRHTNGSVDTTFTATTDATPMVIRQQPDGKILVGGDFTQVNSVATPKLVRLNLDGSLDGSFSLSVANGAVTSQPRRLLVQPDGKILVGGSVQVRLNGGNVTLPLVRLNADGTLDSAFTQKVQAVAGSLTFADIALQADGRVVGVGEFTLARPSVVNAVRFMADGSVDLDCFVISRPNGAVYTVAAQADGSLLMGGMFSDVAVAGSVANSHQYLITPARMKWSEAEAQAVKLGGHLVSIGSVKENNFVANTLVPMAGLSSNPVWIGIHDIGTEGLFSWSSGDPANFSSWSAGEPNNYNNEDVGALNYFTNVAGNWVDTPDAGVPNPGLSNDGPYYGVIEVDPGSTPPTAQNWVAGRDFKANELAGTTAELANPNATVPQWSYGTRATQTSGSLALTLFAGNEHRNGSNWEGWAQAAPYATVGVVTRPDGDVAPTGVIRPAEIILHPPPTGYSVVRWTAPATGAYNVVAFWQDVDWNAGDGCNASIVKNGTVVVFNSDFDNSNGAFAQQILSLDAGDVVEFLLGTRANDNADTTRFDAMITRVNGLEDVWAAGPDLAVNEKPDGHPKETANPNMNVPAWSYGYRSSYITSGLTLYTAPDHFAGGGTDGAMEGWAGSGKPAVFVNTGSTPHTYNFGFGPNLPFNPGEMMLAPAGTGGPFSVVRWTAPTAGRYDVMAMWQDIDFHGGNGIDAFLLVNGAQVYGQNIDNAHGSSTVQSLDLKAGDLVDFLIGVRGDFAFDVTKFNAFIVRPIDATPRTVASGTITQAATRAEIAANSRIDWADAAPNNTEISANPFVIESSAGHRFFVRKSTEGNFKRLDQGSGWAGNFAPGDALLNHGYSDGPVIIQHASLTGACSAIGMQIQPNQDGPFTATLRAYDANGVLLATVTANGTSANTADNSAVFLGVKSTSENIHSISVDTDTTGFGGDFAINQVSIKASTQNSLSNARDNFARLVTTNSMTPVSLTASPAGPTFSPAASATLSLTSNVTGAQVSFAQLESSTDGVNFQPFSYGVPTSTTTQDWSFPVAALPPGATYFRAAMRNANREETRTHAIGPLITPPALTSAVAVAGEVGTPFTYTATATGRLTGFTTASLPAWATATFDANSSRLTISGTPTTGGTQQITLQPANEAGSTSTILTLSITSAFSSWQEAYFTPAERANPSISGPLGDATGAGIQNLLKYALGIPPKQPGNSGLPAGAVSQDGASKYLTLSYTRDVSAAVTFTVEVSPDLGTWNSGSTHTTEISRVPQAGNKETVTVRDNTPVTPGQRRFIRLRVTE